MGEISIKEIGNKAEPKEIVSTDKTDGVVSPRQRLVGLLNWIKEQKDISDKKEFTPNDVSDQFRAEFSCLFPQELKHLRSDFSNSFPKRIVVHNGHSRVRDETTGDTVKRTKLPDKYLRLKASKSWWTTLSGHLELAVFLEIIKDPQVLEKVKIFIDEYRSDGRNRHPLIKRRDIKIANRIISLVLGDKKLKSQDEVLVGAGTGK